MTSDEMASMTDVYQFIDKDAKHPEQTTSCRPCGGTIPLTVTSLDHTTPAVVA